MGTQQLLLIVLGVIIVGIAIAVGITIFNNQAYNANQQAVSQELNTFGSMIVQWWKTPTSQGGAGQTSASVTQANVANWLGFNGTTFLNTTPSDNGSFKITAASTTAGAESVTLMGLGVEKRNGDFPLITAVINLPSGTFTTTVSAGTAFPTGG